MAKQQLKTGGKDRVEEGPDSRARKAGAEQTSAEPQLERARGRTPRPARQPPKGTGGKGRDARQVRETEGANSKRGNKPDKDEGEDEELQEEEEELFWKGLVDGAYRSRKKRGEWEE